MNEARAVVMGKMLTHFGRKVFEGFTSINFYDNTDIKGWVTDKQGNYEFEYIWKTDTFTLKQVAFNK